MRHPQLVVLEYSGRLAALLRELAEERRWTLHESRQDAVVLRQLRRGAPAVLVLQVGQHLEREFALLAQVSRLAPEVATVVVGDVDHPALAGLAWDLGAAYVLFPPQPRERLTEVVATLLAPEEERA
jgi:DNA-binding NarL/FixJ family response regulator